MAAGDGGEGSPIGVGCCSEERQGIGEFIFLVVGGRIFFIAVLLVLKRRLRMVLLLG